MDNSSISSSLINLKAELYRKQEEFKKQKIDNQNASYVKTKPSEKNEKPSIWSRQNAGVLQRAQADLAAKQEEEDEILKSKKSLEAKVKLYEQLTQSSEIPDEDGSKYYLVDFQKKVIDDRVEKRETERCREDKGSELSNETEIPIPVTPDEEWVDYVDSFGRSRKCMKKDLPDLLKQNRARADGSQSASSPTLLSDDMRREMLRKKWEEKESAALDLPVGPVHYANMQNNEVRTHGVGFYQFSEQESSRQQEMDTLNTMRKETVEERGRKDRIKEKRKALLNARLAKIKHRRKMKDGGLFTADEDEEKDEEEDIGPKVSERVEDQVETKPAEPKLLVRDDAWRKTAPMREWDKGKERLFPKSEQQYVENRREERLAEFAPPSFYEKTDVQSKTYTDKTRVKPFIVHKTAQNSQIIQNSSIKTTPEKLSGIPPPPEVKQTLSDIPMPPELKQHTAPQQRESKNIQESGIISSEYNYFVQPGLVQDTTSHLQWRNVMIQNYANHLQTLQTQPPSVCSETNVNSCFTQGSSQSGMVQPTYPMATSEMQHSNTVSTALTLQQNADLSLNTQSQPGVTDTKPPLPKLSIVDTRLVQNEDAFHSDQTDFHHIGK